MVSIAFLTNEEVLQRNGFWYCLDSIWITEELEPFEEVKPEQLYIKPLSRDIYYAKFPEIPRSESEDENSLNLNGFQAKYGEWKLKISLKRHITEKRDSQLTNSDSSLNNKSRRITSMVESHPKPLGDTAQKETNDERARNFFKRLLESCPPPPIEDLYDTGVASSCSLLLPSIQDDYFNDITVPDYEEFEKEKINLPTEEQTSPSMSTLKISNKKVTFKVESNDCDSWYESLYGLSEIDIDNASQDELEKNTGETSDTDYPSWSDILNECGICNSVLVTKHNNNSKEEILSQSHCVDNAVIQLPEENDELPEDYDAGDDEIGYARFAVFKIHQSLKLVGEGMPDSSPMRDLTDDHSAEHIFNKPQINTTFSGDLYRLAPNPPDLIEDPLNNVTSNSFK